MGSHSKNPIPNQQKEHMNWFQNLDQGDKDKAIQLLSQSIQYYGSINANEDIEKDMEQKFGINPSQTQQLYKFLYSEKAKEKTSQYKGVSYDKQTGKWKVQVSLKGNVKYGGIFNYELNAAKRVNQLCEELGIPLPNPEISTKPNQQYQLKEKTSQYRGVWYDKQTCTWKVIVFLKGQKKKYGGQFNDELDAAKRVNQLCEELGIPQKNPTISAMPNQQHKHDDYQPSNLFNSEILQIDNDNTKKKKRKRQKQINDDDELCAEKYYFYDNLLK